MTHEVITEMVGGGFEGMRIVEGREPPGRDVAVNGVSRRRTKIPNIPAYADNWAITAITPVPEAITLYGLSPHMHLRGKDMKYVVMYPDGQQQPILSVPKNDFNWQLDHDLEKPLKIPAAARSSRRATTTTPPRTSTTRRPRRKCLVRAELGRDVRAVYRVDRPQPGSDQEGDDHPAAAISRGRAAPGSLACTFRKPGVMP